LKLKRLGTIAGLGVVLIIVGLIVAVIPGEVFCDICDGSGKIDCAFCTDGNQICYGCGGTGLNIWGETCAICGGDGLMDCIFCNGRGWNTCTFCNGTGKVMSRYAFLIPGLIIAIVGVTLIPTAFIVSKD